MYKKCMGRFSKVFIVIFSRFRINKRIEHKSKESNLKTSIKI